MLRYGCIVAYSQFHTVSYLVFGFLYPDSRVDCDNVVLIGEQRIDVHFLYFRREAQKCRQTYYYLGVLLLVDALLSARTFYNLICAE